MTRLAAAITLILTTASGLPLTAVAAPKVDGITLELLDRYVTDGGANGATGAEIVAFDARTSRLFVMNASQVSIDVLSVGADGRMAHAGTIDATALGAGANSVDAHDGLLAVAIEASPKTSPGLVVFYDAATLAKLGQVTVGALPDMVTFTPNGRTVLVANEGEPNADYSIDPAGSVSIVDLRMGPGAATVETVGFDGVALPAAAICAGGVRIFGANNPSVAQDLEPEYISTDGKLAFVTLQENNALATISLRDASVVSIRGLGCKDHALNGAGIDASDRDQEPAFATGKINIARWPVKGLFMPDTIDQIRFRNRNFLVTANEGDTRVYPDPCGGSGQPACVLNEERRVGSGSHVLDPVAFPNAAELKLPQNLGRLTVTTRSGDLDGDGDFDEIHVPGARSFSIWDARSGELVYDSGDDFEQITKLALPSRFNSNGGSDTFDTRSDNKGPEPEGLTVGSVRGRTYAFIALERTGGIMSYDVSDPFDPRYVNYTPFPELGDRAPEGLEFVKADDSPTGKPLLFVGNEVSGSVLVYAVVPGGA